MIWRLRTWTSTPCRRLQSGKVDFLAAGISITEEKQQVMDFTNEYYEATQRSWC